MKTFFAWQGGEGGDFVMHMIYWHVYGTIPNVNAIGRQEIAKPVMNFKINTHRLIKCHVPWTDRYFLNTKQKSIILLHNPDPVVWAKKRVIKLADDPKLQLTGKRHLDKKILSAFKQNDLEEAYYWAAGYYINIRENYRYSMQKLLDKTAHLLIENNMITIDDVTNTVQSVMRYLGLDDTLSTDMQTEIQTYSKKQQHIIDTTWNYIV